MNCFLVDKGQAYSYTNLLKDLNERDYYYPYYKTFDLYLYFVNLIKALAFNQSIFLLDSDLNINEIEGVCKNSVNVASQLDGKQYGFIEEVIDAIQKSTSEITIFTSGTTGQPKKVIHTVSSLTRNVRIGDKYMDQTWAFAYNPTHMAGLQVFFQVFENMNTMINVFNYTRLEVYRLISEHQITHISATPTFYRLLLPYDKDYSFVKRVTLGGEKSDSHLYDSIRKIFPRAKINNIYASTEAGSLFAAKGDCFQIPENIRSLFKVVDDELLIHKSLLGKSDSFVFEGEYYCSADLIEWTDKKNGIFRFKSRKNELINIGGYKVNPSEVENVILEIDSIRQVIVYGKINSILGNVLCADIELKGNCKLTELKVREYLNGRLQEFKIPRRIKFVESLSITRTGKLKRI